MPLYIYRDENGHEREMVHRMLYGTAVVCECGATMHRVPQLHPINWGAFRAELHPRIKGLIDHAEENRDKYRKEKETHERIQRIAEQSGGG